MLNKIKIWLLRHLYRYQNHAAWKGHYQSDQAQRLQMSGNNFDLMLFASDDGAERPLIVFFHGGGWVIGDTQSHAPFCQQLSVASGCSVVSVDYRLAPEFRFPAAQEDCLAATLWCGAHSTKLGPNNGSLVLAGDSAGGNLAACTALALPRDPGPTVLGQVLIYPAVDHYTAGYSSYQKYATGHVLTFKLMQWFWDSYLGGLDSADPTAERAMPQRSDDLAVSPPTFLCTAEFDPLRDEGKIFAQKLAAAGVAVASHHFDNSAHGFACSEGPTVHFTEFMNSLTQWLSTLQANPTERELHARSN
ncbi:alpha/beta hydrolase [Halieaceae bacterium IMCC14734]|uniref:Alpha/beta hydrolase n=1 Tax=Candidatus Litorirhabdus singularis TaxID=2518993 RepID=A0ABT3TIP9_9GAMM|nr:alpha/beta hydrolase [Candidatus Litorirhabdus singularis]MCX2982192.1 alpha/beta hydrolase [Candidatus Litorirhabdus singularis]